MKPTYRIITKDRYMNLKGGDVIRLNGIMRVVALGCGDRWGHNRGKYRNGKPKPFTISHAHLQLFKRIRNGYGPTAWYDYHAINNRDNEAYLVEGLDWNVVLAENLQKMRDVGWKIPGDLKRTVREEIYTNRRLDLPWPTLARVLSQSTCFDLETTRWFLRADRFSWDQDEPDWLKEST